MPGDSLLSGPLRRKGPVCVYVCVCVHAPAVWGREKGTCVCCPFPGGGKSTETVAAGPGPGCNHGGHITDLANRGISEKERDAINNCSSALARVAQMVGASSHRLKGCGFYSHSGQAPRLGVRSPVAASMGGSQSVFLT